MHLDGMDAPTEMMIQAEIRFMYLGPNRRSDWPVAEIRLELCDAALAHLATRPPDEWARLFEMLIGRRLEAVDRDEQGAGWDAGQHAGWLLAGLLLTLQRLAGQQVEAWGLIDQDQADSCKVFVAFDHEKAFERAFELATRILTGVLEEGEPARDADGIRASIRALVEGCADTGTPADVWNMIRVGIGCGIPVLRMDRPPYDPVEGPFRIRPNGLVRFGHGHRQLTVDGTFCVNRSASVHPLVFDRAALLERLSAMGWRVPESLRCGSLRRVERALRSLDFPVAVRSARRGVRTAAVQALADAEAVLANADGILAVSADVLVQPWIEGGRLRVMVVGADCLLVQAGDGQPWRAADQDQRAWAERARQTARSLNVGALVVELGGVLDGVGPPWLLEADLAPRLDELLRDQPDLLESCAASFVGWLFPDPGQARIPIAAITGTNGKTTTCHMTRSILSAAGFGVGMTCSDGCMVGGEWISEREEGHFVGHTIVLDHPNTEAAVLESTRGGAGSIGMGFARCQVAACLNVTEDHLDDAIGLRTVAEVADLKRTILERSDDAIVLNADDPHCMAMREHLRGRRLGLVSATRDCVALRELDAAAELIGVLEPVNGEPWLVLHERGRRHAVMACSEMPLGFDNLAGHNLVNALHAAVISFFMGARPEHVAAGLRELKPDFETFRGRLSRVHGFPFEVIMDYAHNPDGLAKLCRFVDRHPTRGRKLINLSVGAQNSDDFLRRSAAVTAGHFDHYVCKNFGLLMGREPEERPRLLRDGLVSAGVAASAITCVADEFESIDATLSLARPGDLVVIIGGKRKREIWNWIRSWPERRVAS